jgi:hypothetical protein
MKSLAAFFFALVACLGTQAAHADALTDMNQVYPALTAGRYADVDAFYATVRRERKRRPDGTFAFEEFYRRVYWYSSDDPAEASYFPKVDQATRDWVAGAPHSHLAAMTRAFVLAYRAEHLSAHGKWKEADQLVGEAHKLMDASRAAGASDPLWYATRLRVASAEGLPRADVVDLIHAAIAVDPYPLRLWQEAAFALSPDGDKPEDLVWLMRLAAQRTADKEGVSMYARVMHEAFFHYASFRASPFGRGGADWDAMHASFVDWKARYPSEYSVDLHAAFACAAYDRTVTAQLLARIPNPRMDIWDLMGGKGFLERCKESMKDPQDRPRTMS